jgi:uncharacterized membrane protein (DUF373 family)
VTDTNRSRADGLQSQPEPEPEPLARSTELVLRIGENAVYALAGVLLVIAAVVVLGSVLYHLALDVFDDVDGAVTESLEGLLLVFIILELLAGVRATMTSHKLVAEPFLIVGIIASIREIVVITLRAGELRGAGGEAFDDAITEISVLGLLVLVLAMASFAVRRKEREPSEQA